MQKCLVPVAAAFMCMAFAAQAQQVGVYEGLTDDGSGVYIQVAQDPNNANLEVKVLSFQLSMVCSKTAETLHDIGIGMSDGEDIVGGKYSFASENFYSIDLVTSMKFQGVNSVKGTVGGNLAAFKPAYGHDKLTKAVQPCISPKQNFTATFTGPAKRVIPAGTLQVGVPPQALR